MGILTAIQRFSLHDGPGIRSTVFFKGCNMRCAWCHNPETLSPAPEVLFYASKCVGCGACAALCPAHKVVDGKMTYDRAACTDDGRCAQVCFSGALEPCGFEADVDRVLREVLQDEDYYKQSGGGVTLSGGEVLLQPAFALDLLRALKARGVHTAIESNLNVDFAVLESLLPYLDLIMCDLKVWDEETHRKWTGAGNARILQNIESLGRTGKPLIVRTPVIPGVNDSEGEIAAIAAFAAKLPNLLYYELLNFNPLGGSKYQALSAENAFSAARPLPEDRLNALAEAAKASGVAVRVG
ncbi:MAG: glycyl-radical enzyme activating protein [Candidatus Spyradocola sp.]|jgi:pyruvate formate lyase activating enzyme